MAASSSEPLKVLIAGSRSIKSPAIFAAAITAALNPEVSPIASILLNGTSFEIVSGAAVGVDTLAREYAQQRNYRLTEFPTRKEDYDKYGRTAPLRRNIDMAEYASLLIAIYDGKSKGTLHMINEMKKRGKPIYTYIVSST